MKGRKVAELITSSSRKHRIVHVSTNLAFPNRQNIGGNSATTVNANTKLGDEVCEDLRLTFPTIDDPCVKRKHVHLSWGQYFCPFFICQRMLAVELQEHVHLIKANLWCIKVSC